MNVFDIVIGALLLFGFYRGFSKGLFIELASLAALIVGVWGAIQFSWFAGGFLKESVDWEEQYISIVAFAITFIIIVIAISWIGKVLTNFADLIALGFLNKVLGGIFSVLKYSLILSIILIIFDKLNKNIPFVTDEKTEDSILYEHVRDLAPMLFSNYLTIESFELDNLQKEKENQDDTI